MTQPRKPTNTTDEKSEKTTRRGPGRPRKQSEPESPKHEDAPELETPEDPKDLPEDVSRDDESPLETPEKPVVPERKETTIVSRVEFLQELVKQATDTKTKLVVPDLVPPLPTFVEDDTQTISEIAASESEDPFVASLFLHVAQSPVDAHAPAWLPRTPNTTGGYS